MHMQTSFSMRQCAPSGIWRGAGNGRPLEIRAISLRDNGGLVIIGGGEGGRHRYRGTNGNFYCPTGGIKEMGYVSFHGM